MVYYYRLSTGSLIREIMKTYIRRREKSDELIILYADWGADENLFIPVISDNFDIILFYNYSANEALVLPEPKKYKSTILIGWSLGVWAAEYLLARTEIKADLAIAVNGTPVPADSRYGIPEHVFEGTLNNVNERSMKKFYMRTFGGKEAYSNYSARLPHRSNKSLHDELRWLYNRTMEQNEPAFKWDYAVISSDDRVFPARNLNSYWEQRKDTAHIEVPWPHFPFYQWNSLKEFVSFVRGYSRGTIIRNYNKPIIKPVIGRSGS